MAKKLTELEKQTSILLASAFIATECIDIRSCRANPEGIIHQVYARLKGWV